MRTEDNAGLLDLRGDRRASRRSTRQTVKITLNGPAAPFANDMALWGASIVSKAAAEAADADWRTEPIGSGPFMLDSWQKGEQIALKKNPHYWEKDADGQPAPVPRSGQPDRPQRRQHPHAQAAGGRDRRGAGRAVQPDRAAEPGPEPGHRRRLRSTASPTSALNQTKPEFTDIKIRQAMNYAIDREAMVQTALFGYGRVACSPINLDLVLHRRVLLHLRSRESQAADGRIERAGRLRRRRCTVAAGDRGGQSARGDDQGHAGADQHRRHDRADRPGHPVGALRPRATTT